MASHINAVGPPGQEIGGYPQHYRHKRTLTPCLAPETCSYQAYCGRRGGSGWKRRAAAL